MHEIKKPTEEQTKVIDDENNIVVTAKPGSGKTFTIVKKINNISQTLLNYQGIIAISYTRKASHELKVRCRKEDIPQIQSFFGTIDHFYLSQIIFPFAKHLTNNLTQLEIQTSVKDVEEYSDLESIKSGISEENEKKLIKSLNDGYVFLDISGETALYILLNVKECKEYLVSRYTHIFIDEYQDCGEIQHKIFLFLVNSGITGMAVGDINQAIYAFSNRFPKYLIELINDTSFTHYEITKNHRCHRSISDYSIKLLGGNIKQPVEDIRIFKINIDGDEKAIATSIQQYIEPIKQKYQVKANNEIAILCRSKNTANIIFENFSLPCKLFVDNELDKLSSYWARFFNDFLQCYFDETIYSVDFVDRYLYQDDIRTYQKALNIIDKLFHINDVELCENLSDIVDLAKLIYPEYNNQHVIEIFNNILITDEKLNSYKPATENEINILTIHKSKGLEFDIVFHLDLYKWIMPLEDCSDEDLIQSLNLHYVGITRAKKACYLMQGTQRHNKKNELKNAEESNFLYIDNLQEFRKCYKWKNV